MKLLVFLLMGVSQIRSQTIPYFYDFENGSQGWTVNNIAGTKWELGTPACGQTSGAYSGMNAWDTDLDSMYVSSTYSALKSPPFVFLGFQEVALSFRYNFNIENCWDYMWFEYSVDSGNTWINITGSQMFHYNWYNNCLFSLPGWHGQTNCWKHTAILLNNLGTNPNVWFHFLFATDLSGNYDGFSLDDFSLYVPGPADAAVISIENPHVFNPISNPQSLDVVIANGGSDTLYSMDVSYSLNGGTPLVSPWTGFLPPFATDTISFSSFLAPAGWSDLCIVVSNPNDTHLENNTLCCEFYNSPVGVNELDVSDEQVVIIPNPSEVSFFLDLRSFSGSKGIRIFSTTGKLLLSEDDIVDSEFHFNSNLAAGIYTVVVEADDQAHRGKLVIVRK